MTYEPMLRHEEASSRPKSQCFRIFYACSNEKPEASKVGQLIRRVVLISGRSLPFEVEAAEDDSWNRLMTQGIKWCGVHGNEWGFSHGSNATEDDMVVSLRRKAGRLSFGGWSSTYASMIHLRSTRHSKASIESRDIERGSVGQRLAPVNTIGVCREPWK